MKNLFACMGGVLTTLVFIAVLPFTSCANSAGSGSGGNPQDSQSNIDYSLGDPQDSQLQINYALGEPPQSEPLPEDKYHVNEDEDSEGIYIEFDIPTSEKYPYWATRVYIDGLGAVAEEVQYLDEGKTKGCFYYPFVEAGKEYTIRFVFLRDEDRDENDKSISFGHLGDDGSIGWFETKVTAGAKSKGEVRFMSKGQIDVKKNGDFRFTEKPTFRNEDLLGKDWEVEIGLVEGISWMHGAERRTKWHTMKEAIPNTKLYDTINLYDKVDIAEGDAYSIDFICVRPILKYTHEGKTYKYQWDSFVRDIYYPPLSPNQIGGVYLEFDVPAKETYSRCDVILDGLGKVAEEIQYLDENKTKGCFFYPFVEAGKDYTIRFSFKKIEPKDSEGFTLPTPGSDTIKDIMLKATAGPWAEGEMRQKDYWDYYHNIYVSENYDLYYDKDRGFFKNENHQFTKNGQIEIGLMEGISWEHGDERRTKWHCAVRIPNEEFSDNNPINLREIKPEDCKDHETHEIDCICVRPILFYKFDEKTTYKYQWDGYTYDIFYPPKSWFEEINTNDSSQVSKIFGTWKAGERWYPREENIFVIANETLQINSQNAKITTTYIKEDGSPFTEDNSFNLRHFLVWHDGCNSDESFPSDDRISIEYSCTISLSDFCKNNDIMGGGIKLQLHKDGKILRMTDEYTHLDYTRQ